MSREITAEVQTWNDITNTIVVRVKELPDLKYRDRITLTIPEGTREDTNAI